MNSSSFTIKKSVLLNTLKELTKVLNKVSKYKFTVLEMTVTDGKLTLVIPGAKYILDCETIHSAKGTIDLPYFLDIIKSQKKQSAFMLPDTMMQAHISEYKGAPLRCRA